ncbi:DUF6165 family protein [Methylosinus sp. Sm6]|uniref:DUF6165 family protein n=1 Tax=Methylosinus sp. Sm6 TaxID=2866948 RepID=UPI001C98FC8F|nr:DUF6165 family protein [Methylosinus sp. Sm6]MBY6241525.1 DUF6165 family protein [Methylosinus sp. Sm6]
MVKRAETPRVQVSWGELFDKITILRIKVDRLTNEAAQQNARRELEILEDSAALLSPLEPALAAAIEELTLVNTALWTIEDDIRDCERGKDFGAVFIELARSVYHKNDERARIKRRINDFLGSDIIEEKSYAEYC